MKKLILLAAFTFMSCTKPDMPADPVVTNPTTCNVQRYTEVRTITYNSSGQVVSDTGYVENGAHSFYSNNCDDCGKILTGGYSGTTQNVHTEIRYKAKCI